MLYELQIATTSGWLRRMRYSTEQAAVLSAARNYPGKMFRVVPVQTHPDPERRAKAVGNLVSDGSRLGRDIDML